MRILQRCQEEFERFLEAFRDVSAAFPKAFPPVSVRFRPFPHSFSTFSALTWTLQRMQKAHTTQGNLIISVDKPPQCRRFRAQPNPPIIILKGVFA